MNYLIKAAEHVYIVVTEYKNICKVSFSAFPENIVIDRRANKPTLFDCTPEEMIKDNFRDLDYVSFEGKLTEKKLMKLLNELVPEIFL